MLISVVTALIIALLKNTWRVDGLGKSGTGLLHFCYRRILLYEKDMRRA
jgi:hypothetical protein